MPCHMKQVFKQAFQATSPYLSSMFLWQFIQIKELKGRRSAGIDLLLLSNWVCYFSSQFHHFLILNINWKHLSVTNCIFHFANYYIDCKMSIMEGTIMGWRDHIYLANTNFFRKRIYDWQWYTNGSKMPCIFLSNCLYLLLLVVLHILLLYESPRFSESIFKLLQAYSERLRWKIRTFYIDNFCSSWFDSRSVTWYVNELK